MKTLDSRSTGQIRCEQLENRRLLSFSPAANYATIGTPSAIVTADFNNDGKLDLVTCANAVTGSFSVFLGNGAGGFGAAQRTVMGTQLTSLAAADFNNDGKLDLVVSDNYDYGFDFLAGKGDGTFQPPIYTESGAVAAVGRFNGDSYTDVLIAWLGPDWETNLEVYRGDGHGGFTAAEPDIWYYGTGRTAVDLNNDGKLDVVTAEGYVFPGNGDGTFQFDWEQPALLDGGEIATGDFTGDGKVDAIVAGNNKVSVLRGRGDGTFDAPITQAVAGNPHTGVANADFNGDGKLDAVLSADNTGAVRLMLGDGDGTLRDAGLFATGSSPSGVVAGDFNRDGRPDVAASNAVSRTVSVLLNDGVWAGTKSYTGPNGGNWATAANWTPSGVPAASDNVSIGGKTVNVSSNVTVAGLTLTGDAKLNLNDKQLTVNYTGSSPIGSWNGSAYTGITGMIQSGRNGGAWNGAGIVTTMSDAIGAAARKTLGVSQTAGSVIVRYTFAGDADLSGGIDGDDFFAIDSGYASSARSYAAGDFDYNGRCDADDYFRIDSNHNKSATPAPMVEAPAAIVPPSAEDESAYERLIAADVGIYPAMA